MIGFSNFEFRQSEIVPLQSFQFWPCHSFHLWKWRGDFLANTDNDHPMPIKGHGKIFNYTQAVVAFEKNLASSYAYEAPPGGNIFTYSGAIQVGLNVSSLVTIVFGFQGFITVSPNLASYYTRVFAYQGGIAVTALPQSIFSHSHFYLGATTTTLNLQSIYSLSRLYIGSVTTSLTPNSFYFQQVTFIGAIHVSLSPQSIIRTVISYVGNITKTLNISGAYNLYVGVNEYYGSISFSFLVLGLFEVEIGAIHDETIPFRYWSQGGLEYPMVIEGVFVYNVIGEN